MFCLFFISVFCDCNERLMVLFSIRGFCQMLVFIKENISYTFFNDKIICKKKGLLLVSVNKLRM